jgi:DNA gyrase/topoisomerase IV subunit A
LTARATSGSIDGDEPAAMRYCVTGMLSSPRAWA